MGTSQSSIHKFDTISKRVEYLSECYPDKELFVFYQGENRDSYTSHQLFTLAGKFAHRLRHQYGFKHQDVIANTLSNSPERLITDLGIILAGCVTLNGQILLADGSDFFLALKNSKCDGIILRPEEGVPSWLLIEPYVSEKTGPNFAQLSCDKAPDTKLAIFVTRKTLGDLQPLLEDLRTKDDDVFVDPATAADDLAVVFTTSGSTGYSKLVPRTHAQTIDAWLSCMDMPFVDPVLYSDRALGWAGGFPFGTYLNGDKRVLLDWFDGHGWRGGEDMWKAICQERCSVAVLLPLDFDNLYRYLSGKEKTESKLKVLVSGAQPLKKSQVTKMLAVSEQVLVMYGSTEAGVAASAFVKDTNVEDFFCGKPVSRISVRILNDNGEDCKPRELGNLQIRGKAVFNGFFNRVEDPDPNTAKCFTKDGWFNTEDLAYFDEDRNIYVIGRSKDTIIYGVAVVYPGWLEAKILTHPDVVEAVVVPVSDPVLYQNICACVKRAEGSHLTVEEIRRFCEKIFISDLASEGTPMPHFFLILNEFPKTYTGKPDKKALTKMAEEKFGIKESGQ